MENEPKERLLAEIIEEHRRDPHPGLGGSRLRLHCTLHLVVETQIADGAPPAVARAVERLVAGGLSHHRAVHAVAAVAAEEVTAAMTGEGRYDEQRYVARLDQLSADQIED